MSENIKKIVIRTDKKEHIWTAIELMLVEHGSVSVSVKSIKDPR